MLLLLAGGVLALVAVGMWLLPRGGSSGNASSMASRAPVPTRAEVPRAPTPPPPPTYEELIAKAVAAEAGQNFGDAIEVVIQARDLDPVRLQAYEMLTRLYAKSGDEARAFESAKEFLKRGGQLTFKTLHNHTVGKCEGVVRITWPRFQFIAADGKDSFAAGRRDLSDLRLEEVKDTPGFAFKHQGRTYKFIPLETDPDSVLKLLR